jgi:type VI protein secretion system component VasF
MTDDLEDGDYFPLTKLPPWIIYDIITELEGDHYNLAHTNRYLYQCVQRVAPTNPQLIRLQREYDKAQDKMQHLTYTGGILGCLGAIVFVVIFASLGLKLGKKVLLPLVIGLVVLWCLIMCVASAFFYHKWKIHQESRRLEYHGRLLSTFRPRNRWRGDHQV